MPAFARYYRGNRRRFYYSFIALPFLFGLSHLMKIGPELRTTHYFLSAMIFFGIWMMILFPRQYLVRDDLTILSLPIGRAEYAKQTFRLLFRTYLLTFIPFWIWIIGTILIFPNYHDWNLPVFGITACAIALPLAFLMMIFSPSPIGVSDKKQIEGSGSIIVIVLILPLFGLIWILDSIDLGNIPILLLLGFVAANSILAYIVMKLSIFYFRMKPDI